MSELQPILKMEKISKSFPGVRALDEVDLEVYAGEVLALVGENGAGKTTLMEILNPHPAPTGFYKQDSGKIFLKGKEINPKNPNDAQRMGISFIHQHFNLSPNLTVAENIFLGRELTKFGILKIINKDLMRDKTNEILDLLGVGISPDSVVGDLSVAQRQIVEIAKALSYDSSLIIMDEPTSVLDRDETMRLFDIVVKLKSKGIAIIFITHRLEEVFKIADRIVTLRDGKRIGELKADEADIDAVVKMMVGRELTMFPKQPANIVGAYGNTPLLEVKGLSREGCLKDISLKLHKGEILGIAGMMGAGRTEMARALFGIDKKSSGHIFVDNKEIKVGSPEDAIKAGFGLVPEDRQLQGLILSMSIKHNITLSNLHKLSRWSVISKPKENRIANQYIDKLRIQAPDMNSIVKGLSGGNQQKVVLAKWLTLNPKILILDEPTRGIDVGAKADVHALISEIAQQGIGIIMISSEMPEILGMSDRIIVMANGKITGELDKEEADQEKIMTYAVMRDN
ncbi:MAG: sugar ABC transporter ATP-binding protein [Candidatus Poribacteria bacterium]